MFCPPTGDMVNLRQEMSAGAMGNIALREVPPIEAALA